MEGKVKRGRLSSIDQLPPEADADIQWATQLLLKKERTQADILFELNDRLSVIGVDPISSSAFNRFSTRKANLTRRLEESRAIAKAVSEAIGPEHADDMTVMLVQLLKQASLELMEHGNLNSKAIMELSRSLSSLVSAQSKSGEVRRNDQTEIDKTKDRAAEAATRGIVEAAPSLDPETVLAMIRKVYRGE